MAKLHGIELKSLKTGFGMEWESATATIYLNGKKLGRYIDRGDGGCASYDFGTTAVNRAIRDQCGEYRWFKGYPLSEMLDMLAAELCFLKKSESQYRRSWNKVKHREGDRAVTVRVMGDGRGTVGTMCFSVNADETRDSATVSRIVKEQVNCSDMAASDGFEFHVADEPTMEFGEPLHCPNVSMA